MDVQIAIVGSGFSGIGLAVQLRKEGVEDYAVLERGSGVGGTWHYNTYPGCACDVPSHLYSFSFAPNPGWSRTYSKQPEIRAYLERVVDDFDVRGRIRLNTEVTAARWTGEAWKIDTSQGPLRAKVLVSATGPLVEPKIPDFPGLETFAGPAFHSARWDHDVDLKGKRVAAVGTGASAIQFVPAIAPDVAQLHVFQRTPPWVMPHSSRPITSLEKRLYAAVPAAQRLVRGGIYTARELLVLGFVKQPRIMNGIQKIAERHMRRAIADPALLERVKPDYTIGCKRILPSNEWYPVLARENVELVTTRSPRCASTPSSRATAPSARSTRSSSAPASTWSTCRSAGWSTAATAARWRRCGTARRARTWAARWPASRTCSSCSARTRASATA